MAWKKFTPVAPTKATVAVSITIPDSTSRAKPFLQIDEPTIKKLGWKPDASLQLEIGEAEHAGKVRIAPAIGEPTTLSRGSRGYRSRIRLGDMPGLANEFFRGAVAFEIVDGALVVTLPDAARGHQLPKGTAEAVARASGRR